MKIHVGSILFSYTKHQSTVEASGSTVEEVFQDLDRQFPGMAFRVIDERQQIRPHIKVYVTNHWTTDLKEKLTLTDEIHIIGALSGG